MGGYEAGQISGGKSLTPLMDDLLQLRLNSGDLGKLRHSTLLLKGSNARG